jgi:aminoglycoside 6'-N-acetyltransferase
MGRMELRGSRVVLRPVVEADVSRLRELHVTPEVARWWWQPSVGWPLDEADDCVLLTIWVDGEVAGFLQFAEETDERYRHASIDLFLGPAFQGRGLGTEALQLTVDYLFDELGHHRITIDPNVENLAAVRSYEKVGFVAVGVMRGYERDPETGVLGDGLLMELVRALS